jgi:aspartate aminotransferase
VDTDQLKIRLAERMSRLGTEGAFDVLVRAKELEAQGREVIHLEIGEPDFATAPHIVEAGVNALRKGWTHYGPPAGLPQLREAVAQEVAASRGIQVDPAEVVITPGAKPIMFFTILALIEEGAEVIYPNPGFPIYESMINFAGGRALPYGLLEDRGFDADIDAILDQLSSRTRLIILNSPHNPTGGVMQRASMARLAQGLQGRDLFVLSDEIYRRLIYEGGHTSISEFPDMRERTIILDGFSKTYAMTGWRLGYGVMHPELARQVSLLMTNSNSCTASFTQIAGVEALKGDQISVEAMKNEFLRRRQLMVEGLNQIPGIRCRSPHGAFYAFPNVTQLGKPSRELADALLREAGVACLSGTAFGDWGEGYLRFSFANSIENIKKALERISGWVSANCAMRN